MIDKDSTPDFSIEHFRKGQLDEFKKVYELYYKTLYLFVFNLTGETQESQDIVTDCFVKLWCLHSRMESQPNIKAFLYVTARNGAIDHIRRLERKRIFHTDIQYSLGNETDRAVINSMIQAEVLGEISHRIEKLPNRCKQVFKLIFYNNLSTSEVSQKLGISNQNVLNQKAKAIQILRSVFKNHALLITEIWVMIFLIIR